MQSVRSENLKVGMLLCFSAELFQQLHEACSRKHDILLTQ